MRPLLKSALGLRRSLLILDDSDRDHDGENISTILSVECDFDAFAARLDGRDAFNSQMVFA